MEGKKGEGSDAARTLYSYSLSTIVFSQGTQMKIEEDPTITPGSIARSPIAAISVGSAKDSELFATSSKPSPTDSISLSSSTWSFNASSSNYSSATGSGGMGKLGGPSKNTWSDSGVTGAAADVWGAGLGTGSGGPTGNSASKTPRGPPPGLSSGKVSGSGSVGGGPGSNGWMPRTSHGQGGNWSAGGGGASGSWYSTWLLLKNLTAQVVQARMGITVGEIKNVSYSFPD